MLYESYETDPRNIKEVEQIIQSYKSVNKSYIDNLNKKFAIRPYQTACFARLEHKFGIWENFEQRPLHLFFNLATGAGKTLIMAENILYLYEQGYRNFIFLVHQKEEINNGNEYL